MAFIDTSELYTGLQTLLGWKGVSGLDTSVSGEYYNTDYLPFDTDVIEAAIPTNETLSDYLNEQTKAGVVMLANELSSNKILKRATKTQLSSFDLFPAGGWKKNTVANNSRFVGISFTLKREQGLEMLLNRIGFQFSQVQTDLTIYLFHSSQVDPITTFDITTTSPFSQYWTSDNIQKLYSSTNTISGGTYFIGYYQDDLQGNAIKFKSDYFDYRRGYCSSCGYGALNKQYKKILKYADIMPFYVDSSNFTTGEMFDMDDVHFVSNSNFGFNFNISINCNITNYLVTNKLQLVRALGYSVAYQVMKNIEYQQQNNFVSDDIIGSIQSDLDGSETNPEKSIAKKLTNAIEELTIDQADLGSVCLPCYKRGAVRNGVA